MKKFWKGTDYTDKQMCEDMANIDLDSFLFNGTSTFSGYSIQKQAKSILVEDQQIYNFTHGGEGIRGFYSFLKGISPIGIVEFEPSWWLSSTFAIMPRWLRDKEGGKIFIETQELEKGTKKGVENYCCILVILYFPIRQFLDNWCLKSTKPWR